MKKKKRNYIPEIFLFIHLLLLFLVTIFVSWTFGELGYAHMKALPITVGIILFIVSILIFVLLRDKLEEE